MRRYSMLFAIVAISIIGLARQGNCDDVFVNTGSIDCLGTQDGFEGCPNNILPQVCPTPPTSCGLFGIGCYDNNNNYVLNRIRKFNVVAQVPKWSQGTAPNGRTAKHVGTSWLCHDKYLC